MPETVSEILEPASAPVASLTTLVTPSLYSEQDRASHRYPLPRKQDTKNRKWLQATGELDGQGFGMESNAVDKALLTTHLVEQLQAFGVEPLWRRTSHMMCVRMWAHMSGDFVHSHDALHMHWCVH